eukprot:scaffold345_cov134-Cylindrotheca_fusiformis.AAC.38
MLELEANDAPLLRRPKFRTGEIPLLLRFPCGRSEKPQETRIVTWDMIPNLRKLDFKDGICNIATKETIVELTAMMKFAALLIALASSASAFAPASPQKSATALCGVLDDTAGSTMPIKSFDPLGLATLGSDATLAWFRASELKHSRVAMLATTGYLVQAAGIHFPGMLSHDVSFESLSAMKPLDAWDAVPDAGKQQIYGMIFLSEIISEANGVHYTKGGDLPTIIFPPINFGTVDEETMKKKRSSELNNGRLAMIAIMSFVAAANIPGSVPALAGNPMF